LHQIIPDLQDWDVTILATDINERFLQKATAGVYGEWSFRKPGMEFKQRYFEKAEKSRYAIRPDIKRLVSFAPSNLVEDVFPSEVNDTHAMDVILCRNALMYFGSPQAKKVVAKFRASLVPDGWLVLSPSEGSQALCTGFVPVNFPGVILYQNREAGPGLERFRVSARIEGSARLFVPETAPRLSCVPGGPDAQGLATCAAPALEDLAGVESLPGRGAAAHALCLEGRYAEAADHLLNSWGSHDPHHARVLPLLARGLANQGKLEEALEWCDRWLGLDRLDTSAHYLRAVVLQELGESVRARHSLQRAIYLHPDFVMAHFALGNLARSCGQANGAVKHFANTSHLLRDHHADDLLPESDGLTAGRLREIVASLAAMERAS
jgi:chemotaxis protein methyltransferase CheR